MGAPLTRTFHHRCYMFGAELLESLEKSVHPIHEAGITFCVCVASDRGRAVE